MYRLVVTSSAKRSLKKLPRKIREDLIAAAKILKTDPYAGEKLSDPLGVLLYCPSLKVINTLFDKTLDTNIMKIYVQ